MDKKILMVLMMGMFMISMASAFEFDNMIKYKDKDMNVSFENCALWVGVCLIDGDHLGDIELKSHSSVTEIKKVGFGKEQVVMYYDFKNWKKYDAGLGDVTFIDMKTGEEIEKDYTFVEWKEVEFDVDDYELVCDTLANGTETDCVNTLVGSHIETKFEWVEFVGTDIPEKKIRIGLKTYVGQGDYTDAVWTIAGKKVSKHITWAGDIDPLYYWSFDETTGTNLNENVSGTLDMTAQNSADVSIAGKIGSAIKFNGVDGTGSYADTSSELVMTNASWSISFWYFNYVMGNPDNVISSFNGNGQAGFQFQNSDNSSWMNMYNTGGGGNPQGFVWNNGTWTYLVYTSDTSTVKLYENGVFVKSTSVVFTPDGNAKLTLGKDMVNTNRSWHGILDELMIVQDELSQEEITFLWNDGDGLTYGDNGFVDSSPNVTLNNPANYTNSTTNAISFNCTGWDDFVLENVTFMLEGVDNETDASPVNNTMITFEKTLSDGDHYWTCKGADNNSQVTTAGQRLISIDTVDPVVSASNLSDIITTSLPTNSTWIYTSADANIDSCYFNSTESATYNTTTCNTTIANLSWTSGGNKTIQFCANDTFGRETCNTEYIWVYSITETIADNPDPVGEGSNVTFNFTVNLTGISTTTATLMINNTVYSPTSTAGTNGYYFERSFIVPDGWGNTTGLHLNWSWNYSISGVTTNASTSTENITVYELAVDNCSTYAQEILNLSLRDEEGNTVTNGSAGANVEVEINLTSLIDPSISIEYSYTFVNESNPRACVPLNLINNTNYTIDITIGFDSTDHVWEFWYLDEGTLDLAGNFNSYTSRNVNLMDLLTTDSTSFLFNYFDIDGQAVEGSIAHVFRKFIGEGLFREVERSKADQNADTIVHLVEEDVIYYFMITLDGEILYTSSTYTALCQEVPCTINIEEGGESAEFETDHDLVDGGGYSINESRSTRMVSLVYSLNETATMNFTLYKYESDGNYTQVNTTVDTGLSGVLTLHVPQSAGNVSFFASIIKDDQFINSEWVDFSSQAVDYFGNVLAIFLGALLILTLGLMAISTGAGVLLWVMVGLFISGALGLFATKLSTGVSIVVYLILAGALLLWKITGGRK